MPLSRHNKIRNRHIGVDLLAAVTGSAVIDAVRSRSWMEGGAAAVMLAALLIWESISIDEEEGS